MTAIKALNTKLRSEIKGPGGFPNGATALKLLEPVLNTTNKEWTLSLRGR